jgi:hypothetical protein
VYSWFLSLLAGNANIVRVSSTRQDRLASLLAVLARVLDEPRFDAVRQRNTVISYPHDDEVTDYLSQHCGIRVVWGGDEAVRSIRRIPLPPLATELPFADRFSMAALGADAISALDDEALRKLAHRFCSDAFVFDQLACSSPRLVFWVGTEGAIETAQARFWPAVRANALARNFAYPEVVGIDRATALFALAASGQIRACATALTEFPARATLAPEVRGFRALHCGGGLFLEANVPRLESALPYLTPKDQTLVHFGLDHAELTSFAARLPARAIDRIVPVGEALHFSYIWDGVNLFQAFTRIVAVHG